MPGGEASVGPAGAPAPGDGGRRSSAVRAGMETARLRGVHCGRAAAFCWSDEAEGYRGRIRTGGERPTVARSVDEVLGLARRGMTVASAARELGVSRMTLARALGARGLREEFEAARARPLQGAAGRGVERIPGAAE